MLLFTYPRDFRLRFESELVATFSDLVGGEWEQKGLAGIARLWRSALADVRNANLAGRWIFDGVPREDREFISAPRPLTSLLSTDCL
jgi:hypothetical protein